VAAVGDFAAAFEALKPRPKAQTLLTGETPEAVAADLKEHLRHGDVVLLKASRAVQLERLIPLLWPSAAPAGGGKTPEVPA
jgi:UDP-N-acetylmuramyl pentapeptide synthase